MEKDPILLYFAESDYKKALAEKQTLVDELNRTFAQCAKLLKRDLTRKECKAILAKPEEYLTEELTKNVSFNGLELSRAKILELLEIDLAPIINVFTRTREIAQACAYEGGVFALPNSYKDDLKKNFQSFAITDAQIELAEALMNLYAAFQQVEKHAGCTAIRTATFKTQQTDYLLSLMV